MLRYVTRVTRNLSHVGIRSTLKLSTSQVNTRFLMAELSLNKWGPVFRRCLVLQLSDVRMPKWRNRLLVDRLSSGELSQCLLAAGRLLLSVSRGGEESRQVHPLASQWDLFRVPPPRGDHSVGDACHTATK